MDSLISSPLYWEDHNIRNRLLALAKVWLQECIETHERCSSIQSSKLPTRLLELGAPSAGEIRLVESCCLTSDATYMTLSHCWGKSNFLRLTAETQPDLRGGISTTILPRTFQDAIETAKYLGAKYLWIDSLCIIQDSKEDWLRESQVMGDVYRNSTCNIAATGSKDGHGGLFFGRSSKLVEPCVVESHWDDAPNGRWHIHQRMLEEQTLLHGPLLNRGWVVQERVLAPRVVHFASRQLYWECHQHDCCETYPRGIPSVITQTRDGLTSLKNSNPALSSDEFKGQTGTMLEEKAAIAWGKIISTFSNCKLTQEGDKLVAVSGLAKATMKIFNSDYLAGLWRNELPVSLLWQVKGARQSDGQPSQRPLVFRAPSWSWASVEGQIEIIGPYCLKYPTPVRVLEAFAEPLGDDPTGQVKNGSIKLLGPLMTLSTRGTETQAISAHSVTQDVYLNGKWGKADSFCLDVEQAYQTLHYLPLIPFGQELDFTTADCYLGLLLEPTHSKKGQFRRCGTLQVSASSHGLHGWKSIINETWHESEENRGDGKYVLTIV
ncbi:hypothetical protein D0Z07_8631 [Hyphodiscus hymeniophilus]|uniref:Heterokaryon incompatibility domain-containing protein n=1 Tax=Hyphodiscus hymeniophilus TaxID=353542 RepID=A0A9P6SQT8_9HELO|nr:hypothetical protein D0Z07_8631 [Hyphodiscus hymeniophilus]